MHGIYSSLRIAQKFHQIETLLTDQYGGLTSKEFENFMEDENIQHLFTAVDHPESNGLNERLNQSLVNRIRCRINELTKPMAWSTIAYKCTTEYNSTLHASTGYSPIYLLTGKRDLVSPLDILTPDTYATDLKAAYKNSLISHDRNNKARSDRNRTYINFSPRDSVYKYC